MRGRVVVSVVVAAVLAAAVLAVVLVRRATTTTPPATPVYAAKMIGVTWQGALPNTTMVFTGQAVRIFDGCAYELQEVTIDRRVMDLGAPIGPEFGCGGGGAGFGPSPKGLVHFDAVTASRHLSWQRTGDRLQLTNTHGVSAQLHNAGPALEAAGQNWVLTEYNDLHGRTHVGKYPAAHLRIDDGVVQAGDLCGPISGNASVSDYEITFTNVHVSDSCPAPHAAQVDPVIRSVFRDTDTYTISGNLLTISGRRRGLLIYEPAG